MRHLLVTVLAAFVVAATCGCATDSSGRLEALLRDLEALQEIQGSANAESPVVPAGDVVPPPASASAVPAPPAKSVTAPVVSAPANEHATLAGTVAPQNTLPATGDDSVTDDADAPDLPSAALPVAPTSPGSELSGILTIQPDCLVQVSVDEDPSLDGSYPVNAIGAIQLGYVGPVILYNKTEEGAAGKIVDVLKSRHFKNANVKVRILRASYDRVQIGGAVNSPGLVKIGAGDSVPLNDLLLRVGGIRPGLKAAKVIITRGGLLSPMAASLPGEEHELVDDDGLPAIPEVYVRNNDLVRVYEGAMGASGGDGMGGSGGRREILVLGEVKRPGIYRFSDVEPCTMMHLIFKMGGLPPYANTKSIRVMRTNDSGFDVEHRVDAREVLSNGDPREDFELQDGDRIVVPARRISLF